MKSLIVAACVLAASGTAVAQQPSAGQPGRQGVLNQFQTVGMSVASAQQIFLGSTNTVYIIDKTENNPTQVAGHAAWAAEYTVSDDSTRPMDIKTNSFCAGGNVLGNGTWLNVGGNQAVTWGGNTAAVQTGSAPYFDVDGGKAVRLLNPCTDKSCNWLDDPALYLTTRRWYPTLETLPDGSIIIIGGNQFGGYVNDATNSNPTYEFFPSKGAPIGLPLLETTLPANLFPLTWLLPSGNLFLQINWATGILDYVANKQYALPDIPDAVRTYPASAGTAMLPLTPANNWTATVLFCGGTNIEPDQWTQDWDMAHYAGSDSCVKMTPDVNANWVEDDKLPEARVMGQLILLPTGKLFMVNGANTGTAGYGNTTWAVGHSYADSPVYTPILYDPNAPDGQRWNRDGLSASPIARMYHSAAVLLPDGSVFVSGSNPNPDYTVGPTVKYPTEYRVERWYPSYFNTRRPEPNGLPTTLSYGGPYFNLSLTSDDLFGNVTNLAETTVVVIRAGFSTHAMNMGQRFVQLQNSYTGNEDGSGVLHVSQMPPNPNILAPGPALLFVVVNGVPSVGVQIMVGNGQIGTQPTSLAAQLPTASLPANASKGGSGGSGKSAAVSSRLVGVKSTATLVMGVVGGLLLASL